MISKSGQANRFYARSRKTRGSTETRWFGKVSAFPMSSPKTVSVITLGCAKNQADTDNLKALLKKRGYEVSEDILKRPNASRWTRS
jgi:hypothetical protein